MAVMETNQESNFPLLGLLLLALGLILAAIVYKSHAVEQHGDAAVLVRSTLECKGPKETWENPDTGRKAHLCELEGGRFGIQIEDWNGEEVTSFVKDKLRRIGQIRNYLKNRGYQMGGIE